MSESTVGYAITLRRNLLTAGVRVLHQHWNILTSLGILDSHVHSAFAPDTQGTYTFVYFSGINSKKEIWKSRNRQHKGLHFEEGSACCYPRNTLQPRDFVKFSKCSLMQQKFAQGRIIFSLIYAPLCLQPPVGRGVGQTELISRSRHQQNQ